MRPRQGRQKKSGAVVSRLLAMFNMLGQSAAGRLVGVREERERRRRARARGRRVHPSGIPKRFRGKPARPMWYVSGPPEAAATPRRRVVDRRERDLWANAYAALHLEGAVRAFLDRTWREGGMRAHAEREAVRSAPGATTVRWRGTFGGVLVAWKLTPGLGSEVIIGGLVGLLLAEGGELVAMRLLAGEPAPDLVAIIQLRLKAVNAAWRERRAALELERAEVGV
jgi:hypothetical protein